MLQWSRLKKMWRLPNGLSNMHTKGIRVEAEIGQLGGVEEHINVNEEHAHLTDSKQAEEFVEKTGCDSLAVAVGTSHGAYKFFGQPENPLRQIERNF